MGAANSNDFVRNEDEMSHKGINDIKLSPAVSDIDIEPPPKYSKVGSLRSSRRYYNRSVSRRNGEINWRDSQMSSSPKLWSPFRKRAADRTKGENKAGVTKAKIPMKLGKRLKGLTKEQLANMILEAAQSNPNLEKELHKICPKPDLLALKKKLEQLLDKMYKAFPLRYMGSMRDSFCYQKVVTHLHAFKTECIDQCDVFFKAGLWCFLLDYTLMIWPIVNRLPEWNDDNQNMDKKILIKHLTARMKLAVCEGDLTKEDCICLRTRVEQALKIDRAIEVILDELEKILKDENKV